MLETIIVFSLEKQLLSPLLSIVNDDNNNKHKSLTKVMVLASFAEVHTHIKKSLNSADKNDNIPSHITKYLNVLYYNNSVYFNLRHIIRKRRKFAPNVAPPVYRNVCPEELNLLFNRSLLIILSLVETEVSSFP